MMAAVRCWTPLGAVKYRIDLPQIPPPKKDLPPFPLPIALSHPFPLLYTTHTISLFSLFLLLLPDSFCHIKSSHPHSPLLSHDPTGLTGLSIKPLLLFPFPSYYPSVLYAFLATQVCPSLHPLHPWYWDSLSSIQARKSPPSSSSSFDIPFHKTTLALCSCPQNIHPARHNPIKGTSTTLLVLHQAMA